MAVRLDVRGADFGERFAALLAGREDVAANVDAAVSAIVRDVRARGDEAVIELTRRFDHFDAGTQPLKVEAAEIVAAVEACDPALRAALELARDRLEIGQRSLLPQDSEHTDALGVTLGARWTAVDSVGLYVPGGTAAYPSSVLMNAVPAKVAGVERIVMTVPAPHDRLNPVVLAAAQLSGVDEIYRIGGAQAIAALAYGTETIRPVAKIVGPGNAYVAAAKRQVFGKVGIDMIAGPSEILVIADRGNDPAWIAADLLSQAEHDALAQSILITDDEIFADEVEREVEHQLGLLPRRDIASASWRDYGAVIVVVEIADAARLANRLAAEHLEIAVDDPQPLLVAIRNAGAIFVGRHTPEAIGDYVGGSNHVLPTGRTARFSSGLSVLDFMKRTSVLTCPAEALHALAPSAIRLAEAEGLAAHAHALAIRLSV